MYSSYNVLLLTIKKCIFLCKQCEKSSVNPVIVTDLHWQRVNVSVSFVQRSLNCFHPCRHRLSKEKKQDVDVSAMMMQWKFHSVVKYRDNAHHLCNSAPYLYLLRHFFFSAWIRMIMSRWELDILLVLPHRQSLVVTGTRKLPLPAGSWLIGQSRRGKCPSQWAVKDAGHGILSFETYCFAKLILAVNIKEPLRTWESFPLDSDAFDSSWIHTGWCLGGFQHFDSKSLATLCHIIHTFSIIGSVVYIQMWYFWLPSKSIKILYIDKSTVIHSWQLSPFPQVHLEWRFKSKLSFPTWCSKFQNNVFFHL